MQALSQSKPMRTSDVETALEMPISPAYCAIACKYVAANIVIAKPRNSCAGGAEEAPMKPSSSIVRDGKHVYYSLNARPLNNPRRVRRAQITRYRPKEESEKSD